MVIKILSLKELPYKCYTGYVLKSETDVEPANNKRAYLFISKSPKCIFLFVEGVEELNDTEKQ